MKSGTGNRSELPKDKKAVHNTLLGVATQSKDLTSETGSEVLTQSTPRVLFREVLNCPMCGERGLSVVAHLFSTKFFGELVLEAGKCSSCGYVYRDVYLADYGEPRRLEVRVTRESGDYLLVKSSSATVIIPELGIEISPGPAAQGYITTARGILETIADLLQGLCPERDGECLEKLENVNKALRGEIGFTLILEDPLGKSVVFKLH